MQIPIGSESTSQGVVDLIAMKAFVWNDETRARSTRRRDSRPISSRSGGAGAREARRGGRRARRRPDGEVPRRRGEFRTTRSAAPPQGNVDCKIVPVLSGSAFKNKGVQTLLDAVVDYLPRPLDVPADRGQKPQHDETYEIARSRMPSAVLGACVQADGRHVLGQLRFFRVYSGTVKSGSYVYNAIKDKRERVGRLMLMHANKREEVEEVQGGRDRRAIGLKDTRTGDTLCRRDKPIILESMEFPDPVIAWPSSRKRRPTRTRWASRCRSLLRKIRRSVCAPTHETGQTIIAGMGELHLEIIVDRMKREFGVEANVGKPQVAYRETITQAGRDSRREVQEAVGRPRPVRPRRDSRSSRQPGEGFVFEDKITGGFDSAAVHQAGRARHPRCAESRRPRRLSDGRHQGDAHRSVRTTKSTRTEMAFKIAGSMAFQERSRRQAGPARDRSCGSKWSRPKSTWAPSTAT